LTVRPGGRDRFEITVREHMVAVDQPPPAGDDTAPTPVELFVASLAACVAVYAQRYLERHAIDTSGLQVTATYDMASDPARVDSVDLDVTVPAVLGEERQAAMLAVASRCTVHNSLTSPPQVRIGISRTAAAA
jgi:putative redox protein